MTFKDGDRVLVDDKPATFHHGPVNGECWVTPDGQGSTVVSVNHIKPTPPAVPHLVKLNRYEGMNHWSQGMSSGRLIETVTVDLRVAKLAEAGVVVYKTLHGWTWANMHGDDTSGYSSIALIATDAAWEYAVGKGMVQP